MLALDGGDAKYSRGVALQTDSPEPQLPGSTQVYSSIVLRVVGCHPDWTAAVAGDDTVKQYQPAS